MALDDAGVQLHREIEASIQSALDSRRPIIHHLNDDSSWLLQIPRPEIAIKRGSRVFFNIVIDPWFTGGQSDVASWFSRQYHAAASAVQSFAELEDLILGVERSASAQNLDSSWEGTVHEDTVETSSLVDVIAVSHEFTDHCHRETLLEAHPDVPVFAFEGAAALIKSWSYFRTVVPIGRISADEQFDWRTSSIHPLLPEWLGICQLRQTEDPFKLHSALLITFNNRHGRPQSKAGEAGRQRHGALQANDDETAEALIYTPHGVDYSEFEVIPKAVPSISTLVFLHGLHNVRVGTATGRFAMQLNLGSHNGLKAQRILKAKYWIGTHDEASLDF